MPLPEKLEIGPYTWAVSDSETDYNRVVVENEGSVWGYIYYGKEKIVLCPDQAETHKRTALMHEVMHAVYHQSSSKHDDPEEDFIRRLAVGLVDTLRRNPEFVAYLVGD